MEGLLSFAKLVLFLVLLKSSVANCESPHFGKTWHSLCLLYMDHRAAVEQSDLDHQWSKRPELKCNVSGFMADCSYCYLKKIPDYLSSDLTTLYLYKNNITKIPGMALAKFYNLKCLDLGINGLRILTNESFSNLSKLIYLDLSQNNLVMKGVFHHLASQPSIDTGVFEPLKNLRALDISRNEQRCPEDLIPTLSSLTDSNVTFLGMQNVINSYMPDVTISRAFAEILPRRLRTLVFSSNSAEDIQDGVFDSLPKTLTQLDISDNRFTFGIYLQNFSKLENLIHLKLNGGIISFDLPTTFPPNGKCTNSNLYGSRSVSSAGSYNDSILQLPLNLKRIDIQYSGWSYSLTQFAIDSNNSITHLNLNGNNFPRLIGPIKGFETLTHLSLVNSNIAFIDTHFFDSFPSLVKLNLSTNSFGNIIFVGNKKPVFKSLKNLQELDLSFTDIRKINYDAFEGLDNLVRLWLQRNPIYYFTVSILHMKHLACMNLSFTELSSLNATTMHALDTIIKRRKYGLIIDFSELPIHCYCENLPFLRWMVTSNITISVYGRNKCVFEDSSELYLTNDFEEMYHKYERECKSRQDLFIAIFVATFVILCIIVGSIVYRFRWKLRYLYYSAYLNIKGKERQVDTSQQFEYDVFTSYVSDDHDFVVKNLYPKLQSLGLKIHIHCFHFVSGEYIASNILNAIQSSRHTLVVLTRNLLDSVWCKFELQMANMEQVHTGRSVLVFLLMENLSKKEMGTELLYHIQNNTYIRYPDPEQHQDERVMELFWSKLASDLRS